jgi:TetR/AcrR family transcriptional repressor of nem operon
MARIVKEYAVRRNEILDVAQRLIYTKGYEQMTIQDILDDLHIAKGLFYYYFVSKQAMLTALLERMMEVMEQVIAPIVQETHCSALEKLRRFFATVARWETDRKPFILGLLHVWYTDDNVIVREKVRDMTVKRVAPFLTTIVRQGIEEGVFTTSYPDQAGEMILSLIQSLQETFAAVLLSPEPDRDDRQRIDVTIAAYTDALERMLGAPSASLRLIEVETVKEWFALRGNSRVG